MSEIVEFNFPTRIIFGPGSLARLSEVLRQKMMKRPLLVTDRNLVELDLCRDVKAQMEGTEGPVPVFSGIEGNPIVSQVVHGRDAFQKQGCDSLVILGGGAALDVGKAIALMVAHEGDPLDYAEGTKNQRAATKPLPPMVAIPTTAGTGSEVGRSSVISEDQSRAKRILFAPQMLPPVVIADPNLTLSLPAGLTAATGFDALSHCIEAYCAKGFHPICDGIALQGIRLINENLVTAVEDGSHIEARSHMLCASMMGAIAFQKGLGVTHSCAHALSTVHDLHHGLANALMLESCVRFNLEDETLQKRLLPMAQALGLNSISGIPDKIATLLAQCKIKRGLKEYDISISPTLVATAVADPCHQLNPRQVTEADFRRIFDVAAT